MMQEGTKRRARLFLGLLGLAVVGSAVWGTVSGAVFRDAPLRGALLGAITGLIVFGAIISAEIFLPQTRLGQALEHAPFLVTFAAKCFVYVAVILLVVGGQLALRFVDAALTLSGALPLELDQHASGMASALGIAVVVLVVPSFVVLVQMVRLIGERTLRDVVLGRYHRPRAEERFFLFVDIAGSTPIAERIGPAAAHRFLGQVFRVASGPIDDHGGEIYQYVGDEVVITWSASEGRERARPLACFFAIEQALEQAAPGFDRDFGAAPRLRAALHAGPVIAGEIGESRRAIVFHGDVMNTTSRIENATRDLKRSFLVSEEALSRIEGKEAYVFVDLGPQQLRGREAPVHVYAVELARKALEPAAGQ